MTTPPDPFATPDPHGSGTPPTDGRPPTYGQPAYGQPAPSGQPAFGQAPSGQGPFDQQPFGTAPPAAPRNGLGTAALVLGLVALLTGVFVLGGVLGLVAIALGSIGRGRAKRGEATNGGAALAGIIFGALGIGLTILSIVGVATLFGEQFGNLNDCIQSAGDNRTAVEQCQRDFENQVR